MGCVDSSSASVPRKASDRATGVESSRAGHVCEGCRDERAVETSDEEDSGALVDEPLGSMPQELVELVDAVWRAVGALWEPVPRGLYPISADLEHVTVKEPSYAHEEVSSPPSDARRRKATAVTRSS
jgi:hypothetical protein